MGIKNLIPFTCIVLEWGQEPHTDISKSGKIKPWLDTTKIEYFLFLLFFICNIGDQNSFQKCCWECHKFSRYLVINRSVGLQHITKVSTIYHLGSINVFVVVRPKAVDWPTDQHCSPQSHETEDVACLYLANGSKASHKTYGRRRQKIGSDDRRGERRRIGETGGKHKH